MSGRRIFFLANLTFKTLNVSGVFEAIEEAVFFLKDGLFEDFACGVWAAEVHAKENAKWKSNKVKLRD